MRFNTNRRDRLAFDDVAGDYLVRPGIPGDVVDWAAQESALHRGMRVLEVGAGTGQLTAELRRLGAQVTALEPGGRLREVLVSQFAGDDNVSVEGGLFEDHHPTAAYDGVWSANAFHWVDPAVGYERAGDALRGDGWLVLIWTYLLVHDHEVAATLRHQVTGGDLTFFCPDSTDDFLADVDDAAADGRDQLEASGRFGPPVWRTFVSSLSVPAGDYPSLVLSYANAAATGAEGDRAELRKRIAESLGEQRIDAIDMDQHAYALVAPAHS